VPERIETKRPECKKPVVETRLASIRRWVHPELAEATSWAQSRACRGACRRGLLLSRRYPDLEVGKLFNL